MRMASSEGPSCRVQVLLVLSMRVGLRVVIVSRVAHVMVVIVAVMVKGDTVELLEWICYFAHGCSKARV